MSLEIEYRGHTVRYGENSDEWYCSDLGYSSEKLSSVKARIDKMYLDLRKKSAVSCFEISSYRGAKKTPSSIVEYLKNNEGKKNWNSKPEPIVHTVAVVARRDGSDKASRREAKANELMPDTPEAHAAWAIFEEKSELLKHAERAANKAFDAIPRVTVDMMADLIAVSKSAQEGA